MTPFVIAVCLLFTLSVLFYVFYLPGTLKLGPEKTRASYLRERKDVVYENLRDLNFEYKAGKVPDSDYASMKTALEEEAAAILAEIARLESSGSAPQTPLKPQKGSRN
jgi:hypothetical protein